MAGHYYAQPASKRRVRRLIKKLSPAVVVLLLIGGAVFAWTRLTAPTDTQPDTSGVRTSVQGSSRQVFRTPFFQFQASDTWREDPESSKDGMYVYRSFRGPLIEQDLRIYVNTEPDEMAVTRVMPVSVSDEGLLRPKGGISDHCETVAPTGQKDDIELTLKGVRIECDPDGALFSVMAGVEGGDTMLKLVRPDGEPARYTIVYRDLTANPMGRDMRSIINSFQAR